MDTMFKSRESWCAARESTVRKLGLSFSSDGTSSVAKGQNTISNQFLGRKRLDGLGEKDPFNGDVTKFDQWLQGKAFVVDGGGDVITFNKGVIKGIDKNWARDNPCSYQVIQPGVIEYSLLSSVVYRHCIEVTPDLSGFQVITNKGVTRGSIKERRQEPAITKQSKSFSKAPISLHVRP